MSDTNQNHPVVSLWPYERQIGFLAGYLSDDGEFKRESDERSYGIYKDDGYARTNFIRLRPFMRKEKEAEQYPPNLLLSSNGALGTSLLLASDFVIRALHARLEGRIRSQLPFGEDRPTWKIPFYGPTETTTDIYVCFSRSVASLLLSSIEFRDHAIRVRLQELRNIQDESLKKSMQIRTKD